MSKHKLRRDQVRKWGARERGHKNFKKKEKKMENFWLTDIIQTFKAHLIGR